MGGKIGALFLVAATVLPGAGEASAKVKPMLRIEQIRTTADSHDWWESTDTAMRVCGTYCKGDAIEKCWAQRGSTRNFVLEDVQFCKSRGSGSDRQHWCGCACRVECIVN